MDWRIGKTAQGPVAEMVQGSAAEAVQGSRPLSSAMTDKENALELQKLVERGRLGLESACWYQSPQARR